MFTQKSWIKVSQIGRILPHKTDEGFVDIKRIESATYVSFTRKKLK